MESGALEPLMSLARSEDIELEIQRFAVLAIANLSSSVDNHKAVVEEGGFALADFFIKCPRSRNTSVCCICIS